jgi:hypothetical protein
VEKLKAEAADATKASAFSRVVELSNKALAIAPNDPELYLQRCVVLCHASR